MNTEDLIARVMKQWQPPAYYTLTEVRNGTGYGRSEGYADVLAMSVWPSRGLELIGAELKVSRSDWLRELKDPGKADKFFKFCHRWYLISGPGVVLNESEIPAPWGWISAGDKGFKTVKAAPELKPEPPDIHLLASIFRKVGASIQNLVPEYEVTKRALDLANEMRERDRDGIESYRKAQIETEQKFEKLRSAVNAFNNATGLCLDAWNGGDEEFYAKGKLLRAWLHGGCKSFEATLEQWVQTADHTAKYLTHSLNEFRAAKQHMPEEIIRQVEAQ